MLNESYEALAKINRLRARLEHQGVTLQIEGAYWQEIAELAALAAHAIQFEIELNPDAAVRVSRLPNACTGLQ